MQQKNKRRLLWAGGILLFLFLLHLALPFILVRYVNKTLDNIPGYTGSVEWIHVNLFRGSYTIHKLNIQIEEGEVPDPFIFSEKVDLSVEWKALFDGRIVGEIVLFDPVLTFIPKVDTSGVSQTGENVDWTEPIKELMPLQINRFEVLNGRIHYKDLDADPSVDLYFTNFHGIATNLTNATNKQEELPSDLHISATSIGNGNLAINGKLDIIKQTPDFDIDLSFETVDLPALNDFITAYAKADVEKGTLNLYAEFVGVDGQLTGYVKPLLTNVEILTWEKDKKKPLQMVWEAILSVVSEVFENQKKEQLGTKVPLEGSYEQIGAGIFPAIGSALRNAFIRALRDETDDTIDLTDGEEDAEK